MFSVDILRAFRRDAHAKMCFFLGAGWSDVTRKRAHCVVSIGMQPQQLPLCAHRRLGALIALTRMSLPKA